MIGFIGAGKVGKTMGLYFKNAGIQLAGFYSRSLNSAAEAAKITKSNSFADLATLIKEANIIGITTPDDSITEIAEAIAKIPAPWEEKIVLHMSGVNSSEILSALRYKGATVLSLHPMLSFTNDPFKSSADIEKAVFTIEGTGEDYNKFKDLLKNIGMKIIEINTEDKVIYHAAASIISNYTVTLIDIGKQLLFSIGFSEEQALKLAEPLIRKTVNNVIDFGTEQALTGPISRGDVGTVIKHLEKLADYNRNITEIYRLLGMETAELALRGKKIDGKSEMRLKEVLTNG